MIVDIGGGTTDVAVISLAGTVVSESIKVAGDDFNEAIVRYMRKKHNLLIGERTGEEIKIKIGTCYPRQEELAIDVRGRNLVTGLPKTVTITSEETLEALSESANQIVEAVHHLPLENFRLDLSFQAVLVQLVARNAEHFAHALG
jgi:rod shape-determining protein MreB